MPNWIDLACRDITGRVKETDAKIARAIRRDLFAAVAMHGYLAADLNNTHTQSTVADEAVGMADALIAELDKEPDKGPGEYKPDWLKDQT